MSSTTAARHDAGAWRLPVGVAVALGVTSPLTRRGGWLTQANLAFDDHPPARRFSGHIDTVTVDSTFAWLPRARLFDPPQLVRP